MRDWLINFVESPAAKWLGLIAAILAVGGAAFGAFQLLFGRKIRNQKDAIVKLIEENDLLKERISLLDSDEWLAEAASKRSVGDDEGANRLLERGIERALPRLKEVAVSLAENYATKILASPESSLRSAGHYARLADNLKSDTVTRKLLMSIDNIESDFTDEDGDLTEEMIDLAQKFSDVGTGDNAIHVVLALTNLSVKHAKLGFSTGVRFAQRAVTIAKSELGQESEFTLGARNSLVFSLVLSSKHTEALKEAKNLLPYFETIYGDDDPNTLRLRILISQARWNRGETDTALIEARGIADVSRMHPSLGPRNRQTLQAQYLALAIESESTQIGQNELARILSEVEEMHEVYKKSNDQESHAALTTAALVAKLKEKCGDVTGGLDLAEQVLQLEKCSAEMGPCHFDTLITEKDVARMRWLTGSTPRALIDVKDLIERMNSHPALGPEHSSTLEAVALERAIQGK